MHTFQRGRRRLAVVSALVSLSLAVAACGSDDPTNDGGPAPVTDPGAVTSGPTTTAGDTSATTEPAGDTSATTEPAGDMPAPEQAEGGLPMEGSTGDAVRGEELVVAVALQASTLDPAAINTAFVNYVQPAYEPLLHRRSDGSLQPGLAESWEMGDGNLSMTLQIREGVTFSDGDPVTSDAVVASLEHAQASGTGNGFFLADSTITADGNTVTIDLTSPNPVLPLMLSGAYGIGGIISPTGLANPDALNPDNPSHGAGPYVYDPEASVAGDHYVYVANPDYYAKDLYQHYDQIELRVISEPQATLNAVQTGQVDVATGDLSTIAQAQSASLQVVGVPFVWQGLNLIDRDGVVSEPLGDVRVRQAINYAIDRQTIVDALLPGIAVATGTIVVPGSDAWSAAAAERYSYDPDKARELLAEAGYPDGFEFDLLSVQFAGIDVLAEAVVGQLAEVGITANITLTTDEASYVGGMMDQTYPAVAVGYGSQPLHLMGQGLFMPNAQPFNGFASQSDELDELYAAAASAPADEVATANQAVVEFLTENAWFAPVAFGPVSYIAQADVGGLRVSPDSPVVELTEWYQLG